MHFLTISILFSAVYGFEYSEEIKKYHNAEIDPCEDFYRHTCRLDSPGWLPKSLVMKQAKEQYFNETLRFRSSPKSFEIVNDVVRNPSITTVEFVQMSSEVFKKMCESGLETFGFLKRIEKMIFGEKQCMGSGCLGHLSKDPDCERSVGHIESVLRKVGNSFQYTLDSGRTMFRQKIIYAFEQYLKTFSFTSTYDKSRLPEMFSTFSEMKEIVLELIQKTPWAQNHNATEMLASAVAPIHLKNLLDVTENAALTILSSLNQQYLECRQLYVNVGHPLVDGFCYLDIFVMSARNLKYLELDKEINRGGYLIAAYTIYPTISLGFMWFYIFLNSESRAAKYGFPGYTLAHELSHALIQGAEGDIITYFSKEAGNCIQKQYDSICKEFDEGDCFIGEVNFEENGADVLAMDIVNILFERHYINKEKRSRQVENHTELQKMFYSIASTLCMNGKSVAKPGDVHAPENIRINALVNHPAFQKAFQCPDNSRMMRTKTKQCSIYGENAPLHRRRLSPNNFM